LNATEKMPDDALPAVIGVEAAFHVSPPSVDLNTRATAAPPVPNQTLVFPWTAMQVPLAANAPSPSSAEGKCSLGMSFQFAPPSDVLITMKRPSTGSLIAMPVRAFPKGERVEESLSVMIAELKRPGAPAINSLVYPRLFAGPDAQQISRVRIDAVHIAEVQLLGAWHDCRLPSRAAVGRQRISASIAARPGNPLAYCADAAKARCRTALLRRPLRLRDNAKRNQ
jgi:hypothetical protein